MGIERFRCAGVRGPLGPWSLSHALPARNDRDMSEDSPLPHDRDQPPTAPTEAHSLSSAPAATPVAGQDQSPARWSSGHGGAEPRRLSPLLPRRQTPRLLVEVDGSPASQGALVWALREAARREGTVVALTVLDEPPEAPLGSRPA